MKLTVLILVLFCACSIERSALAPGGGVPPDAMMESGRPDSAPPMDSAPPTDTGAEVDAPADTSVMDSAPVDSAIPDAMPDGDATVDTSVPPSCADRFSSTSGFTTVCSDAPSRCVLEIDVDPSRRTCNSVCAEIGWTCEAASGAASTFPRCSVTPIGTCDQNLRIQVCVCVAP